MSPKELAAQMIARINSGFQNEHHWLNWRTTYQDQVNALPLPLRRQVWAAWDNASHAAFSKATR